ncbi:MAG TPA: tRNA (adenosine(37)-N6)-threonylcarbamoyltransferase complex ATPase subunit type 1 TsaE [Kofleriaceae bacterium]|nr:tRNA (adenosine(37)-N6)-threonylcarbamoyltransferase complex ATPase subunit type 1 TsaE [Kofleriaceae bacterium]
MDEAMDAAVGDRVRSGGGGGDGGDGGDGGGAIVLADAEATARAGAALAPLLAGGDAIALIGDLGAGKTTLVAGLARALGAASASSPTFALVNEYPGGRLVVWHVDLYRIEREAELAELGLEELLGEPRGVCLIEWADRFAVMPPDHLRLELGHAGGAGDEHRTLVAAGTGPRGQALARGLRAALLAWPE